MRLISFGCSFTYGDGLDEIRTEMPSRLAWPTVAADHLGIECVNLGKSGNSNISILKAMMDHGWRDGDRACILWTYWGRDTIFDHGEREHMILPTSDTELSNTYYAAHPDRDMFTRSCMYYRLAIAYLRNLGVAFAMGSLCDLSVAIAASDRHALVDHSHFDFNRFIDRTRDGIHAGPMQHAEWGRLFAEAVSHNDQT